MAATTTGHAIDGRVPNNRRRPRRTLSTRNLAAGAPMLAAGAMGAVLAGFAALPATAHACGGLGCFNSLYFYGEAPKSAREFGPWYSKKVTGNGYTSEAITNEPWGGQGCAQMQKHDGGYTGYVCKTSGTAIWGNTLLNTRPLCWQVHSTGTLLSCRSAGILQQ